MTLDCETPGQLRGSKTPSPEIPQIRARLKGTEVTERAQNADFRRKPQIFADSPLLLGTWRAQETVENRRKPKIFAENRRKPQIGLRHLRCVTFSLALSESNKKIPPTPTPNSYKNNNIKRHEKQNFRVFLVLS